MTRSLFGFSVLLFSVSVSSSVHGQEPINGADSATQPSPGHVIFKEQFRYLSLDLDENRRDRRGEIDDAVFFTTLGVGLQADLSLSLRFPTVFRERELNDSNRTEREEGVGDVTGVLKWRVIRHDTSALDTFRLSLIGGAEVRTGDAPFTTDAYNPIFGLAFTKIAGRHGLNGSFNYTITTDGNDEPILPGESKADLFRYDLAYLYRVSPKEYGADTHAAWYALCEVNGLYETNGDHEVLIAPGIMYEARTWTAELSVQLPLWSDIEERAELDYAIVTGIRFSW